MLIFRALVRLWYLAFDFFSFISKYDKTLDRRIICQGSQDVTRYLLPYYCLLWRSRFLLLYAVTIDHLHINYNEGVQIWNLHIETFDFIELT